MEALQCLRQHGQWLAVLVNVSFVSFYMFILKANKMNNILSSFELPPVAGHKHVVIGYLIPFIEKV